MTASRLRPPGNIAVINKIMFVSNFLDSQDVFLYIVQEESKSAREKTHMMKSFLILWRNNMKKSKILLAALIGLASVINSSAWSTGKQPLVPAFKVGSDSDIISQRDLMQLNLELLQQIPSFKGKSAEYVVETVQQRFGSLCDRDEDAILENNIPLQQLQMAVKILGPVTNNALPSEDFFRELQESISTIKPVKRPIIIKPASQSTKEKRISESNMQHQKEIEQINTQHQQDLEQLKMQLSAQFQEDIAQLNMHHQQEIDQLKEKEQQTYGAVQQLSILLLDNLKYLTEYK